MPNNLINNSRLDSALRGEALYGDDFCPEEIAEWFEDETLGYSLLEHLDAKSDIYLYHALDDAYAWTMLPFGMLDVMGLGSAWGSEFTSISKKINSLKIVEPATKFWRSKIGGISTSYFKPLPSGELPFEDASFDVVVAFGVLHHIPNVSRVLSEINRVLRPGGKIFIREPVTSMGDWRLPRRGLTKRERGLPRDYIAEACLRIGLHLYRQRIVGFAPLISLMNKVKCSQPWNNRIFVWVDSMLSRLTEWNWTYHRTTILSRFAPTIGCWILIKPQGSKSNKQ